MTVKKLELQLKKQQLVFRINVLDEQSLRMYKIHKKQLELRDNSDAQNHQRVKFIAADITFVVYIAEIENRELISSTLYNITEEVKVLMTYKNYEDMFFKQRVNELSEHDNQDHEIKLDKSKLNFKSLYNLFISELMILHKYINENLEKDFIQ
ncbi:MAG: hypothetical protein M1836_002866 [Candelina mexicana]|nr:MAG: hypothetical protein M1836_002866 [Candelina mexicana]